MDSIENDNFLKNDNDEFDTMKILINIKEEKYLLRIFPSKDKVTLTFKLEEEKIQTYYYIETFDLRDFRQKNKLFLSDDSIQELFSHLKEIRKNCSIELEKKIKQINVCFKHNFDSKFVLNFTLMKYIVSQKNLNPILVELIQENKAKIKMLKRQIAKLNKAIQAKTDIINDFNNNIASINNSINNITNSNNANKNEEEENNKSDNNKDDEEEELITKENTFVQTKEPEEKRYISNNRKRKNKKQNKKIKNQKTFFVNRFQKKRKINFNIKTKKEKKYFRTPPKKLSNINNKTYLNENKISSYLFTINNSNLNNTIE